MVKVQFIVDFRGKLTSEAYYRIGEIAEFDVAIAQQLFDEGRAKPAEVEVEPKARRRKKSDE